MDPAAGATILVVDDEQPLLDLLVSYLARLGYQVEACASSQEALRRVRERPSEYALLFTDAKMPDMGGLELITKVTELNPGVRVVLTSGSPVGIPAVLPGRAGKSKFLQKPYVPAELADLVKALLQS